jgi:hypothetical protein
MAHLAPLRAAAESLRRFVSVDTGPYRLEGGGARRGFMVVAVLGTGRSWTGGLRTGRGDECARVLTYSSGNHYKHSNLPPAYLHPRLAYREGESRVESDPVSLINRCGMPTWEEGKKVAKGIRTKRGFGTWFCARTMPDKD